MAASLFSSLKSIFFKSCRLRIICRLTTSSYSNNEHLSKYIYWQCRYQQEAEDLGFDWFLSSEDILDFLINNIGQYSVDKERPITYLDLGCGTSKLAGNILAHSPTPVNMVLLDFVCEALYYQKHYVSLSSARAAESSCQLVCADVMFLPFGDCSFNMVLDKGTMDALLKHSTKGHSKAALMMSEVKRVITPGGRFLQVSDEDPDTRLVLLEELAHTCCDTGYFCDALTDLKASETSQSLGASLESLKCMPRYNTGDIADNETLCKKQMPSWFFKIIPTKWNKEYFIYWADKL